MDFKAVASHSKGKKHQRNLETFLNYRLTIISIKLCRPVLHLPRQLDLQVGRFKVTSIKQTFSRQKYCGCFILSRTIIPTSQMSRSTNCSPECFQILILPKGFLVERRKQHTFAVLALHHISDLSFLRRLLAHSYFFLMKAFAKRHS